MPPALIGALGVAGSIGGAIIGSSAAKKAAQTQADAANQAAQAQLQAAQLAANTQLDIFGQTKSALAPYLNTGTAALGQLASIFGLGPMMGAGGAAGGQSGTPDYKAFLAQNPNLAKGYQQNLLNPNYHESPDDFVKRQLSEHPDVFGKLPMPMTGGVGQMAGSATQGFNPQAAMKALEQYPGYQFQLQQGTNALDRSAASRGLLLSGAQLKGTQEFGQGLASSVWGDYLNRLGGIASLGENAGANVGNLGQATGANVGQSYLAGGQGAAAGYLGAGQANAAGQVGSANSWISGLQGGLNNALQFYSLLHPSVSTSMGQSPLLGTSNLNTNPGIYTGSLLNNVPDLTLSDARAKEDIQRVGETHEGIPIYSFRYKSGGPRTMGVMAQEVERVKPHAVKNVRGLKMVDYQALSPLAKHYKEAA